MFFNNNFLFAICVRIYVRSVHFSMYETINSTKEHVFAVAKDKLNKKNRTIFFMKNK